jgi:hypothetical protein
MRPLVVVDAANVVGSVPNGWWRDRVGATRRLRDALATLSTQGFPDVPPDLAPPWDVVLVVEGAARPVADEEGPASVAVVAAAGSGDDAIVDLAAQAAPDRPCLVITADRELRERVRERGALVFGPRILPHLRRGHAPSGGD